jgi:hypothetical protein
MTRSQPSSLILALLRFVASENEPLAGDLAEEWRRGRSGVWFWRQMLGALVVTAWAAWRTRTDEPAGLCLVARTPLDRPSRSLELIDTATINLGGIRVRGIGGLGLIAIIMLITIVLPQAWFLVLAGLTGGVIFGVAAIIRRRNCGLSGPDDSAPLTLFGSQGPDASLPGKATVRDAGTIRLATV